MPILLFSRRRLGKKLTCNLLDDAGLPVCLKGGSGRKAVGKYAGRTAATGGNVLWKPDPRYHNHHSAGSVTHGNSRPQKGRDAFWGKYFQHRNIRSRRRRGLPTRRCAPSIMNISIASEGLTLQSLITTEVDICFQLYSSLHDETLVGYHPGNASARHKIEKEPRKMIFSASIDFQGRTCHVAAKPA